MKIIRTGDYEEMSRRAAALIAAQIILKPDSVLGLATGSTPVGAYRQLIVWHREGLLDLSAVRTVNLDEYEGLDATSPQSYIRFMRENLLDAAGIDPANAHIPCGTASDPEAECARYDALIRDLGGIDLQLLGIGPNGHIGFNEPGDSFIAGTHRVKLTEATIRANRRFFAHESDVPRHAYTMGVRDILQARRVLMAVSGRSKAGVLRDALRGPITPQNPASLLQLHPDFTLVADADALSEFDRDCGLL